MRRYHFVYCVLYTLSFPTQLASSAPTRTNAIQIRNALPIADVSWGLPHLLHSLSPNKCCRLVLRHAHSFFHTHHHQTTYLVQAAHQQDQAPNRASSIPHLACMEDSIPTAVVVVLGRAGRRRPIVEVLWERAGWVSLGIGAVGSWPGLLW